MRLIDATPETCYPYLYDHLDDIHMIAAQNAIDDMPTVDAVPVVRCRECKWYCEYYCGWRQIIGELPEDFYCADGERKGGTSDERKTDKKGV